MCFFSERFFKKIFLLLMFWNIIIIHFVSIFSLIAFGTWWGVFSVQREAFYIFRSWKVNFLLFFHNFFFSFFLLFKFQVVVVALLILCFSLLAFFPVIISVGCFCLLFLKGFLLKALHYFYLKNFSEIFNFPRTLLCSLSHSLPAC